MNILLSLSSSSDLSAIVRTSSQFYRIFATYKQSILSAFLLNAISRNVEADFILAHRAQRIWKLVPEHKEDPRIGDERHIDSLNQESLAILGQFDFSKDERLYKLISDPALLQDMWEFYCNFEHLIISYSARSLSNLHQSSSDSSSNELSSTEWARLQRGFFRLEIYTCLFQFSQVSSFGSRFSVSSTDSASKFAAMLRAWEIGEMCCVVMEELSDRIEDDFVTMTKKKMDACDSASEERETKGGEKKENVCLGILEMNGLRWYSETCKPNYRSEHIEYLVSRGMLCVRKLTMKVPFSIARRMVVKLDLEADGKLPMLPELEDLNPREQKEEEFVAGHRHPAENDNDPDSDDMCLRRCNFGWIWATTGDGVGLYGLNGPNVPANCELRNQGYVFWDKARLLSFKKFQSPRDSANFWEFPSGYQEHSERPGVDTMLKDVPVYWKVIEEMAAEILGLQANGNYDDGNSFLVIDWRN